MFRPSSLSCARSLMSGAIETIIHSGSVCPLPLKRYRLPTITIEDNVAPMGGMFILDDHTADWILNLHLDSFDDQAFWMSLFTHALVFSRLWKTT
jgi:hypothetical protein